MKKLFQPILDEVNKFENADKLAEHMSTEQLEDLKIDIAKKIMSGKIKDVKDKEDQEDD